MGRKNHRVGQRKSHRDDLKAIHYHEGNRRIHQTSRMKNFLARKYPEVREY